MDLKSNSQTATILFLITPLWKASEKSLLGLAALDPESELQDQSELGDQARVEAAEKDVRV